MIILNKICPFRFSLKVAIFLTCGKHLHDCIISVTAYLRQFDYYNHVLSQESEWFATFIDLQCAYKIFRFEFETIRRREISWELFTLLLYLHGKSTRNMVQRYVTIIMWIEF